MLAGLALCVVLILAVPVSVWISAQWLTVSSWKVELGLDGGSVRLAVVGDLHDRQFGTDNETLVEQIRRQKPDLILLDGDMLNADSPSDQVPVTLIEQLVSVAPVYYALGNHEIAYMDRGHGELITNLEEAGAVVLEQSYADLEINGVDLRLGGMYEYAFGLNGNNDAAAAPDDVKAFLTEFQDTHRTKVMMAHRPDSFIFGDASQVWDIDLVVSAHLHGGQVVLPFLGGVYGGDQGWFPKYVHGLYPCGDMQLFVTSGLGTSRETLPRWNNRPEIAVLELS